MKKLGSLTSTKLFSACLMIILSICVFPVIKSQQARCEIGEETVLPVLMYHHLDTESSAGTVVSEQLFRSHMEAIQNAGFTAVTPQQIFFYVTKGIPLPEKPVLITFDDGYTSNLTIGAPILQEFGLRATVFVIGINEGEQLYAHSGAPLLPPRFSYDEAEYWVDAEIIDLQSHTYDMHQLESYGFSGRDGMLPLPHESSAAYKAAILEDVRNAQRRRDGHGFGPMIALAYPFGYHSEELDSILDECGIDMTFTIEEHLNLLTVGDPSCLRMMGRLNVSEWITPDKLVTMMTPSSES